MDMTALLAINGWCKIKPRKQGSVMAVPQGFRNDREYRVIAGFFPNSSQDFHLQVINEVGQITPLMASDVTMIHYEEEVHKWQWSFDTEATQWKVTIPEDYRNHLYVVACYGRYGSEDVQIHPDYVLWNVDRSVLTVNWPVATKGLLILR
jgi:hypothetical protein